MYHLEQQKAKAANLVVNCNTSTTIYDHNDYVLLRDVYNLIEATHQAAIEECVRVAEDMASKTVWKAGGVPHINAADLITTLKADK